ncbi:sensor histidine kinase [Streptomyces uncialis]|uniref:sensor histidine kinase n=1 Tax=Streptomyces uncialis TaxID=1048205 RepID=UPI003869A814|nr:sensor domain-containing protein [Streptomyces uncialis]
MRPAPRRVPHRPPTSRAPKPQPPAPPPVPAPTGPHTSGSRPFRTRLTRPRPSGTTTSGSLASGIPASGRTRLSRTSESPAFRRTRPRTPWRRPWRPVGYLLTGALIGPAVLVALTVTAAAGLALAPLLVGLPLLAALALGGLPFARFERWRLRLVDPAALPDPHRRVTAPGPGAWARVRYQEAATWREFGYTVLSALVLWPLEALAVLLALGAPLSLVAAPVLMATVGGGTEVKVLKLWLVTSWPLALGCAVLGALLTAAGLRVLAALAGPRAALTRTLLGPRGGADRAIRELSRSRVRLVDAFDAERRRIERDLHDGAQQRLVALAMTLGLARLDAPPGPLGDSLARAHTEATAVLTELRELIHGIHPQLLTDLGLEAAVQDAADRSPVPVDVTADLPGRLPAAVESAAWFVVREALTNTARHSGADRARVTAWHTGRSLVLEIGDDGRGGADPAAGSGLTGLGDRVSVLDGTLSLSSPPGGPTLLRVEIPCEPTQRTRSPG